jgi:glycosyltransferase involved in cell wall biosynthesis
MSICSISVVIPVYNGTNTITELVNRIVKVLKEESFEIILVDDGSNDNSWNNISTLNQHDPNRIRGIKLARNFGQHSALMSGLSYCKGELIITMDDDLQHPPEEIPKLLLQQKEDESALVYGISKTKKNSSIRKAGSYFVRRSSKYFADNSAGEGSAFRLLSKELADKIVKGHQGGYVFIDEIIHWYTSQISFVEVEHHCSKKKQSSYSIFKLIGLYLDIFINYSAYPLKFMIYGGMLFSTLSFLLGIRFIIRRIIMDVPIGFTAIIVSILFSSSLIMFGLGIIGKYLFNIYQQQNGKPLYSIQKVI